MEEKVEMLYLCNWGKDRKKSWSGTHLSLYEALQNYFNLVDYKKGFIERTCSNRYLRKLIGAYNIDKIKNSITEKRILKAAEKKIVFSFNAVPKYYDGLNYIYFDMNWQSIKNLHDKNYNLFRYSNFAHFSNKQIDKYSIDQNRFLESCNGIFTMSRWLADELTKNQGYPKSKVHHVGGGVQFIFSKCRLLSKARK